MSARLDSISRDLGCSERTLRRWASEGMLRSEIRGRGEIRLPVAEELYLRSHWQILEGLRRALRTEPSVRLAVLFGSAAVGEDRPDSDVDLLVEHENDDPREVVRLQRRLSRHLDRPVHVVSSAAAARSPALLVDVLTEGRVVVDRVGAWPRLLRKRDWASSAAAADESATHAGAWAAVEEARQRTAV